jgi:hypothetical protein
LDGIYLVSQVRSQEIDGCTQLIGEPLYLEPVPALKYNILLLISPVKEKLKSLIWQEFLQNSLAKVTSGSNK